MGKEWLYYFSGGSRSSSKRGGKTSKDQMKETINTNTISTAAAAATTSPSAGCINSLLLLFDFHHPFHFPNLDHNPPDSFLNFSLEEPLNIVAPHKGVEAPRNSSELIEQSCSFEQVPTSSSNSSTIKKMNMKIKTSGSSRTYHDISSSECSSSSPAGTKTPTLVARLMGLDLLPENSSPRPTSSSSSNHYLSNSQAQNRPENSRKSNVHDAMHSTGCRSLPETPRVSSSSKSDAEQRLSLQINKENHSNESLGSCREFEFSKFLATKIAADNHEENNMSPGRYAKQIVKQFKESVNRRVGRDITNIYVTNINEDVVDYNEQRRDQHIVLLKSKKPPNTRDHHESNVTPTSYSPRHRFLETKNKPAATPVSKNRQPGTYSPKVLPLSPLSPSPNNNQQQKCVTVSFSSMPKAPQAHVARKEDAHQQQKCNKSVGSRDMSYVASRLKKPPQTSDLIRNKQEESFVKPSSTNRATQVLDKNKSKKTLLSNHVPTFLPVKKQAPPPLTTTLLQTQEHEACATLPPLSRSLSTSYKSPELAKVLKNDDINSNGTTTTTTGEELTEYISAILKCTGIWEFTPLSSIKWYTYYSYPLDPSIYYHLQILFPKQNKLMFHLVDELLVHIMRPHFIWRRYEYWFKSEISNGPRLVKILCEKVRGYPSADCRVLEDIDALIDRDLGRKEGAMTALVEEEGDEIVSEIEGDILQRLVHETVDVVIFSVSRE